jgi:hypothetical protein
MAADPFPFLSCNPGRANLPKHSTSSQRCDRLLAASLAYPRRYIQEQTPLSTHTHPIVPAISARSFPCVWPHWIHLLMPCPMPPPRCPIAFARDAAWIPWSTPSVDRHRPILKPPPSLSSLILSASPLSISLTRAFPGPIPASRRTRPRSRPRAVPRAVQLVDVHARCSVALLRPSSDLNTFILSPFSLLVLISRLPGSGLVRRSPTPEVRPRRCRNFSTPSPSTWTLPAYPRCRSSLCELGFVTAIFAPSPSSPFAPPR